MVVNAQKNLIEPRADFVSDLFNREILADSYQAFVESFPLKDDFLYQVIFERNSEIVQTQKPHIAVANLRKLFTATFRVSEVSGFDRMSLRDLSRETGMSMGAIYSCISKKEDIALMIADVVRLSSELTRHYAAQAESNWQAIERSIRFHLYASTMLQPWYFFLYFETRSLPDEQQQASTKIELDAIEGFESRILEGVKAGEFQSVDPTMVANAIVVLLEDWYLKPWKTRRSQNKDKDIEAQINNYNQSMQKLVKKLLA